MLDVDGHGFLRVCAVARSAGPIRDSLLGDPLRRTPQQIPVAINAMDVPFSSDKFRITRAFTNAVTRRGVEHFYQAKLSAAEFAAIRARRFVTFTELATQAGGYSGISVAHNPAYDDSADQMWRKCVGDLS